MRPIAVRLSPHRLLLALLVPAGLLWFFAGAFVGDLYYQRAMVLKEQIYFDSAATSLEHAIAWQPRQAAYYRELGRLYLAMSPWRRDGRRWIDQGIAAYRQSLSVNPRDSRTSFDLGMAYVAAHDVGRAQAAFQSGLAVDPNNPSFYVARGAVYELQGRLDDAKAMFERAYLLSPYDREALRKQLRFLDQIGAPPRK